jgi:raffinose/stachyose/melibiose transport system permease protein
MTTLATTPEPGIDTPSPSRATKDGASASSRHVKQRRNWVGGVLSWVWLAVVLLPIYYIVITSVTRQGEYYTRNPLLPPADPTLAPYGQVFSSGFFLYFFNSVVVTLVSVAVIVAICLPAAFTIVRSQSRFVRATYSLFLLGLAIPLQATIVPLFFMLNNVGLYDTLWAIILPSIAFAIPITVLIFVNFLRDIPEELFEAMRVEGASNWRILVTLVLPLARPAIATVTIYDALQVWNGFLLPLVLTQSDSKRLLPLALWNFQGQFSVDVPATLAAVVLSALPILVLYVLARRQLISGLTAGVGK